LHAGNLLGYEGKPEERYAVWVDENFRGDAGDRNEGREKIGRGDKIRTCDPLHPMQVRYQAAPRPDRDRMIAQMGFEDEAA
jgi:hypothetical protein